MKFPGDSVSTSFPAMDQDAFSILLDPTEIKVKARVRVKGEIRKVVTDDGKVSARYATNLKTQYILVQVHNSCHFTLLIGGVRHLK